MRKSLKKTMAFVTTAAMSLSLLVGASFTKNVKAEDNLLSGANWTHTHEAWETNDALISNTRVSSNGNGGFTANISITGWQREWYGEEYMPDDAWPYADGWCDKPFQLTSDATISVTPKSTYELKFDISNEMTTEAGAPTEKNVAVLVKPVNGGENLMRTTVRVPKNGTYQFDGKFTVPENYADDSVIIEFAYGSFAYSYTVSSSSLIKMMPADVREKYVWAPGTTENVNAKGKLDFSNITLAQVEYEAPTEKPTTPTETPTTGNSGNNGSSTGGTTIIREKCTCPYCTGQIKPGTDNSTAKVAKPSIKVKNIKGGKVQVTWKKVANATKYQVKSVVGKKTVVKTTSKTSYTFKKLKKKTCKVSVRAYGSAGYGNWSSVKKVKVKK